MIKLIFKNLKNSLTASVLVLSLIASNTLADLVYAFDNPGNNYNSDNAINSQQSNDSTNYQSNLVDTAKLQEALQKKNDKLTEELNAAQADVSNLEEQNKLYKEKINVLQQQIDFINNNIRTLNAEIENQQKNIDQKQKQIDKNADTLTAMIRNFYVSGEAYNMDMLMDAQSFSDYLDKADMLKNVSVHYTQLVNTLKDQIAQVQEEKKQKEYMHKNLDKSKKDLNEKQSELTTVLNQNESLLAFLGDDQAYLKKQIDSNSEAMKEIDKRISNYYQDQKSGKITTYQRQANKSGNMFEWPVPGFTYISSYWGDGRDHKGIDIAGAGIYGSPIVASADGIVVISNSGNYGGGYGNYVMLDHGSYYGTLYAHMSEVIVSEGQFVKQGDVIGYVGSTGDSTGPHLHFEVIVDGVKQNPFDYLGK